MTERRRARLSLLVLLGTGACTFQSAVPTSAQVECGQDGGSSACPQGFTCQAALGRCVATSALLQPSVGVAASSIQLTPAIGNLQTTFQLQFQTTRALALGLNLSFVTSLFPAKKLAGIQEPGKLLVS